ncbi:hypothetical protein B0H19DRAFT_206168 [Mycena capillaripes]|nr:hypothetical protein B0H19DRAFT_602846 [Mycena capillaripes]KAJ6588425.1 hypothetical protein B0H19DRAFT_206168 [Mycena capillaripes]
MRFLHLAECPSLNTASNHSISSHPTCLESPLDVSVVTARSSRRRRPPRRQNFVQIWQKCAFLHLAECPSLNTASNHSISSHPTCLASPFDFCVVTARSSRRRRPPRRRNFVQIWQKCAFLHLAECPSLNTASNHSISSHPTCLASPFDVCVVTARSSRRRRSPQCQNFVQIWQKCAFCTELSAPPLILPQITQFLRSLLT